MTLVQAVTHCTGFPVSIAVRDTRCLEYQQILCPILNYSRRLQSREYCIFYSNHLPAGVTAEGLRNISCARGADRTICYGRSALGWLGPGYPWEGKRAEGCSAAGWEQSQWERLPALAMHRDRLRWAILRALSRARDGSNHGTRTVRENSLSMASLRGSCSSQLWSANRTPGPTLYYAFSPILITKIFNNSFPVISLSVTG